MLDLGKRFDLASLTSEMSLNGHQNGCGREPSESDHHVGSKEAADLLGLSTRQVRRLAPDLDAEIVGGRLVFNHQTVIEYAEEKRNGRHR